MPALSMLDMLKPLPDRVVRPEGDGRPPVIPAEILADAHDEAARFIKDARREAACLVEEAGAQADSVRETARREGWQAGLQSARAEAEARCDQEVDRMRAALSAEMQEIVDGIGEARADLWKRQEQEMVAFVLDISRQVIKTEIQQNPNVVMEILRSAMRRVTDKENLRVRVSLGDVERIRAAREDITQIVDGIRGLEIVDDRRIGPGGCVIETNAGTIDAKVETQIAEIERVLTVADEQG
jgi:flagellar assembly protein FliH